MPSTNQCIGSHYDELKQRVFYFNYNSSGYNGIYVYDMKTNAIQPLLISYVDSIEDIFGFDPKYPIASINILYRTEEEGDILHWTDRKNRPMKLNILEALVSGKTYGSNWKKSYLTVARPMPLKSPVCSYNDDSTKSTNNLRNKLYQFRYRWVYKDNTKSTWGPWSKMFAPLNADTLANDSVQTKNNRIDVSVNTGGKDCYKIEIAARHNIGSAFTDTMLITTLDKAALGISNDTLYVYNFYNDSSYSYIDKTEESLLFDYSPKTANAQELLNGNILAYGGIKEGNTFDKKLDVSFVSSTIANATTTSLQITQTNSTYQYSSCALSRNAILFTFGGQLTDVISVSLNVNYVFPLPEPPNGPGGTQTLSKTANYTIVGGDAIQSVLTALKAQFNSAGSNFVAVITGDGYTCSTLPANSILVSASQGGSNMETHGTYNIVRSSAAATDVSNSVYKSGSRYSFGMVYFDEFGVTNGVVTTDGFNVVAPEGSVDTLGTAAISIPKFTLSINHQPPSWAKSFSFVRSDNLSISRFYPIVSENAVRGTGDYVDYMYFNIDKYQKNTTGLRLYEFQKGDRVRILGRKGSVSPSPTDSYIIREYAVIDLADGTSTQPWDATATDSNVTWIKIPYDSTVMSTYDTSGSPDYFYLEVYSPFSYSTTDNKIFYEFGENYAITTDVNGNLVHEGQIQSQVSGTSSLLQIPNSTITATPVVQSGNLFVGTYKYKFEFVYANGSSVPSASTSVVTVTGSTKVNLTNIPTTYGTTITGVIARKVYRTEVNGSDYKLLVTFNDDTTTTYQDNIADSSLGALMPQPAIYEFIRGDVYQRTRIDPTTIATLYIIDQSVSSKYDSLIVDKGRAFVVDPYAKETYFPTTIRYSLDYQQNTNINNTNRFRPENLDEYDRQRGDIQRLVTRGRQLRVFQNRGCGMAPIYQNVMQTADGSDVVTQNAAVLNKIQYYQGEFGLGDQYCSLASSAQADYFTDPVIGAQVRLSNDGLTSLTEIYKAHYYLNDKLTKYQKKTSGGTPLPDKFGNGGYAKILGVYDVFEEQFTTCLQGSADSTNPITEMTFAFSETRNCYVSFYDYYPEWICNAGNLIITWKNGELWAHNNTTTYSNFYGTQYSPSIKLVFNDHQNIKKHFNTITTLGNTTWVAETQGDINTNLGQQSKLIQSDFRVKDDKYHASFKRDALSTGGLYNGNVLKGTWLEMNLKPVNPQNLVDLYYIELSILQPLNNR